MGVEVAVERDDGDGGGRWRKVRRRVSAAGCGEKSLGNILQEGFDACLHVGGGF